MDYEAIRQSYKPDLIKVLYIGESRPASGKFFYNSDSLLYSAIHNAFSLSFFKEEKFNNNFLQFFKDCGCYLEDMSIYPMNKLSDELRIEMRKTLVKPLAEKIKLIQPLVIISIMKGITNEIRNAIKLSSSDFDFKNFYEASFPFNDQKMITSIEEHNFILQSLLQKKII